ncbi:Phospholipid metabolism protein [Umbelopsis nana]
MKLFKSVHTYDYPWSLVSAANWQKYPNEHCSHVHAVDVLDRKVDPETGVLITERLITVKQNVPTIILKLMGTGYTQYVREISFIDPKQKTLTMDSINLTLSNYMSVAESIKYEEHPTEPAKTQFTQQAAISAGTKLARWASLVEDFSAKRFQQNADIGREGFNQVLHRFVVRAEASTQTQPQTASS